MPGLLSNAELAQIQADASAAVLSLNCDVQRQTETADPYGSTTSSWSIITSVLCGMTEPTAGQLANYSFLIGSLAAWQVKLPINTDVKIEDRLIVSGQTLTVQVVLAPRSYPGLLTVLASEVKES